MNALNDDREYDIRVEQLIVGECGVRKTVIDRVEYLSASCSVTLVTNGRTKMLVDCSSSYERPLMLEVLMGRHIKPEEVDYLVITHWHVDHCGNMNLFPNATIIDPHHCVNYKLSEFGGSVWTSLFSGHSESDLAVFVEQRVVSDSETAIGNLRRVVIAGDLFERENDDYENCWRASSLMPDRQLIAREICSSNADIIVPGHGAAFSMNRKNLYDFSLKTCLPPIICLMAFDHGPNQRCRVFAAKFSGGVLLINTGGPKQTNDLLAAMSKENIVADDVSYIVITTANVTTMGNVNLFPCAKVYTTTDRSLPPHFYAPADSVDCIVKDEIMLLSAPLSGGPSEQLMVMVKQTHQLEYLVVCEELSTRMEWLQQRMFGSRESMPTMHIKTTRFLTDQ